MTQDSCRQHRITVTVLDSSQIHQLTDCQLIDPMNQSACGLDKLRTGQISLSYSQDVNKGLYLKNRNNLLAPAWAQMPGQLTNAANNLRSGQRADAAANGSS